MEPYAVLETGGKQYRVKADDTLQVERLRSQEGETIQLTPVLAISDGKQLKVGTPEVDGAVVTAAVVAHIRGEKVVSFKKKRRKGYSRKIGHRQELTVLRVEKIG
jgi:large subunit ribosomal protein L21